MFGLSEDSDFSVHLTNHRVGVQMSHKAFGQNYLLCKSTDLKSDFTVVYDFVLIYFSKSESI